MNLQSLVKIIAREREKHKEAIKMKKAGTQTKEIDVNVSLKDYLKMIPTMDMLEEIKSRNETHMLVYDEITKDGAGTYMRYITKGVKEEDA